MSDLFIDPWLPAPGFSGGVPANKPAILIQVFRVNGTPGDGESVPADISLELLPSVACMVIEEREGPTPSSAMFRYKFDSRNPLSPQTVEDAMSTLSTTAQYPQLIEIGDRLAVSATQPDGTVVWIFDGFPLTWEFQIAGNVSRVVMPAVGVAKRCWDNFIGGAIWRDSDEPEAVNDVPTDRVLQFNPRGVPNASPSTADSGDDPNTYPVVMDPRVTGTDTDGIDFPRVWDLPMAVAHLLFVNNDAVWVEGPDRDELTALLVAREPIDGVGFDPTDSSTYTSSPIAAPDTPMTGRAWPNAVHDLIKDVGYGMSFDLTTDVNGNPDTKLALFLKQGSPPLPLLLQEEGATFDPVQTNLGECELARDLSGVVNQWEVVGAQLGYEASYILTPGFPSAAADCASAASLQAFNSADPNFITGANQDKYRLWVFDESGETHYGINSTTAVTGEETSLDDVLGPPDMTTGVPQYVYRRRPPLGALFTPDSGGKVLRYSLSISQAYGGDYPAVWDGSATDWQPIKGGYQVLPDRIGISINCQNPDGWDIGKSSAAGMPYGGTGVVKAVTSIANPAGVNPAFYLRLTVVIEGDLALKATAARQDSSPLEPVIRRQVDARDRFFKHVVVAHSEFNATGSPVTIRDDTDLAMAEATALRTATEAGVMGGTAVIPRFTAVYEIGDRIDQILGRGLGLRTDNGGPGFAPVLPMVVSRRFELEGGQRTILELSDSGLDRRKYGLARRPPPARSPGQGKVSLGGIRTNAEVAPSERDGTGAVL